MGSFRRYNERGQKVAWCRLTERTTSNGREYAYGYLTVGRTRNRFLVYFRNDDTMMLSMRARVFRRGRFGRYIRYRRSYTRRIRCRMWRHISKAGSAYVAGRMRVGSMSLRCYMDNKAVNGQYIVFTLLNTRSLARRRVRRSYRRGMRRAYRRIMWRRRSYRRAYRRAYRRFNRFRRWYNRRRYWR